ncbi:MAG: MliC family protein [Alphaproteobacteria bacterium]|nr:MliC family protein [Alphaproteobacteria bacterium]
MNKILIGGLCVLALAACEKKEKPLAETTTKCGDFDVAIKVYNERIDTVINSVKVSMPQVVAASGAKYQTEDASVVLWNKGEDWMMIVTDGEQEKIIECANI